MLDRELVLRYVALKMKSYMDYKPPMISFLNYSMEELGNSNQDTLSHLKDDILQAFAIAKEIFGEDAFRKSLVEGGKSKVINRALFEAVSEIGRASCRE